MIIWVLWIFFVSSSFFDGAKGWDRGWENDLPVSRDYRVVDLDEGGYLRDLERDTDTSDKILMTGEGDGESQCCHE